MSTNQLCTNNRDKGLILQAQETYLQHPATHNNTARIRQISLMEFYGNPGDLLPLSNNFDP